MVYITKNGDAVKNKEELLANWVKSSTELISEQGNIIKELYTTIKLLADRVFTLENRQEMTWKGLQELTKLLSELNTKI